MSLSALAVLFASLPAKVAAATLVVGVAAGGVAVTNGPPPEAEPGLERAFEESGLEVPVGPSAAEEAEEAAERKAEAKQRRADARAKAAERTTKAEALDAADEHAPDAAAEGFKRAGAGAGNADAAGSQPDDANQSGARRDQATQSETEARTQAEVRESDARAEAADESTDASTSGKVLESETRSDASTREADARTNAGADLAP